MGCDGAQSGPGEVGDDLGDLIGIELVAALDEQTAGAFGEPHEGVGQRGSVTLVDVDRDQGSNRFGGLGGDALHRSVELVVSPRARTEQESEGVVIIRHPTEVGAKAQFGLALAIGRLGRRLGDVAEQPVADLVDQGLIQISLGVEVLVQDRLGDSDGVGHIVHRCAMETVRREHDEGDIENLLASGVGGKSRGHALPDGNRPLVVSEAAFSVVAFGCLDRIAENDRRGEQDAADDERDDHQAGHRRREADREGDDEQRHRHGDEQVADPIREQRPLGDLGSASRAPGRWHRRQVECSTYSRSMLRADRPRS